jgi:hypothetical protein
MSESTKPIYTRPEDLAAIQAELQALGLAAKRIFVATPDHPSNTVLRNLSGGIIPGTRSLADTLDKLEQAIAAGATGLDFTTRQPAPLSQDSILKRKEGK